MQYQHLNTQGREMPQGALSAQHAFPWLLAPGAAVPRPSQGTPVSRLQ